MKCCSIASILLSGTLLWLFEHSQLKQDLIGQSQALIIYFRSEVATKELDLFMKLVS